MKLIVGLGNPGKEYKNTKHNIGYILIDNYNLNQKWQTKYNADYILKTIRGEQILFVKPLTYMNLSGEAVKKFVDFYKLNYQDILVIQDDLDLEFAKIKIKFESGFGGHNGIKSIIDNLKTNKFYRLKIGINDQTNIEAKDYVLSKLNDKQNTKIDEIKNNCKEIIDLFIDGKIEKAMNKFN